MNYPFTLNMEHAYMYRGVLLTGRTCEPDPITATWIDSLTIRQRDNLVALWQHEGTLGLVWRTEIPQGFRELDDASIPDGDYWHIAESIALTCYT